MQNRGSSVCARDWDGKCQRVTEAGDWTMRCTVLAITWLLGVSAAGLAQDADLAAGMPQRRYLFYEAEKVFTDRQRWLTQKWYKPSGGEWLYGNPQRGTPTGTVELPGNGPWLVWMRIWDWGTVNRRCVLEVNGEPSYVCGGGGTGLWMWYHTHVVESAQLDLRLIAMDKLDAWVDCIAVTDDPSWVPPHEMANGRVYVSDAPHERFARRPALIWTRVPLQQLIVSAYRRSFSLQGDDTIANAVISVRGIGVWKLWLNGEEMAEGDGSDGPVTVDLAPGLRNGPNALCIELSALELLGGEALPGVWVNGRIETTDGWTLNLCTSPAWRTITDPPPDWLKPDLDDSQWEHPWARVEQKPFAAS